LTGAQPHFHGDAWNGLVYGRKQWFITPPSHAFFARSGQRVIDWLATPSKLAELGARDEESEAAAEEEVEEEVEHDNAGAGTNADDGGGGVDGSEWLLDDDDHHDETEGGTEGKHRGQVELLCVQEAGDLIYVPRLWGHAVLNLAQSVGAAVEFEQQ